MSKKPFGFVTSKGRLVGDDILNKYTTKEASQQLKADAFQSAYGPEKLVVPLYNPLQLTNLLEMNTYHMRCCKIKARDSAGLGWLIKSKVDGLEESTEFNTLRGFFEDQLEPITTTLDRMMYDYEVMGYGALELTREGYKHDGEPANLFHIPAHTLRVHLSGEKLCQIRGGKKKWFKFIGVEKDIDKATGQEYPLGSLDVNKCATEIIWFKNYTPKSDYYGMPDIIPALGAIYGDISRRDYNIAFFDNYGVPAYAVFITGDFDMGDTDENGRTDFEKTIEDHFKNLRKEPHSTLILSVPSGQGGEVEIKFEPLSVETKEASFRLYRTDNRDEVLSAHAVPPYRAGIAETGSLGGSTAEESTEIYKTSVIKPRQEMIETALNLHVVQNGFEIYEWEFRLGSIDNTDEEHDLKMVQGLFSMGAITPNQIINHFGERFGLTVSDSPYMNMHYINGTPVEEREVNETVNSTLKELDRAFKRLGHGSAK